MMLTRQQALDEAKRQKQALRTLGGWRRVLFIFAACLMSVAAFGLRSGGPPRCLGFAAAVLGGVSLLLAFIVDLSIRNGRRNVENILRSLQ